MAGACDCRRDCSFMRQSFPTFQVFYVRLEANAEPLESNVCIYLYYRFVGHFLWVEVSHQNGQQCNMLLSIRNCLVSNINNRILEFANCGPVYSSLKQT